MTAGSADGIDVSAFDGLTTAEFSAVAASRGERLLRITSGIADAVSAEQVFVALVDRVAEAIDASSAALWLVDEDDRVARLARARGYSTRTVQQLEAIPLDGTGGPPVIDSIRRGTPIWIPSQEALFEEYPHLRSVATVGRRYRMAVLPLQSQGRVLGALGLTIETEGDIAVEDRGFLLLVARYAGQALERLRLLEAARAAASEHSRLYQETREAHVRAEQLYGFAQVVTAARTLDEVFDAALSAIEKALGTPRLAILLLDNDGVMRFRAWRRLSVEYRNAVEGHSPWPRDATRFDPVLVEDAHQDASLAAFADLFQRERIGALAFFPLATGGTLLGKFMVYFEQPHRFTTHDVETAGAIANHVASVITRFAAIHRLEDTIRSNELFAAVLAHDLRNPLGAIMTSAQVLLMRHEGEGAGATAKDRQPLGRILRSGQRMTSMIDQLLDVARIRSGGGIQVQPQPASLAELCTQAIAELELAHPEWRIRCDVRGELGGTWDPGRLLQVISNVVGNAGQHGAQGSEILVSLDGSRPKKVRLEVRNEGTVPEAIRPNLFDPFAARRDRLHHGGLGLGLFIVREVVRAHGGTVDVACDATHTTVTIKLPRRTTPRHARHARAG